MGEVYFYHLTRSPLEVTLPQVLARALGAGWRVTLRGPDRGRLQWLDEKLWLGPEDSFLPHGLSGGAHDADQPVLLTDAPGLAPGTACLVAIDGAEVLPAEAASLQRVCIMFDGNDETATETARRQWRELTAAGLGAQYWSEGGGRWEKKQERAAQTA